MSRAIGASLTSTIGNTITELFETAFQTLPGPASLPGELSYQQNGLMFGSRLIQETRRASIPDPAVRTDLVNFVGNCTTFDIADGTISNKIAKEVFAAMWEAQSASAALADELIESKGLKQISDSGALEKIVDEVLAANAKSVEEFRAGKEKAFNALIGQAMKASKGKANPAQLTELLKLKLG